MTAQVDERILDLIKSGAHYQLIGERLGLTRDAVSGRVRRMKEKGVVIPFPELRRQTPKPPSPTSKVTAKVMRVSGSPLKLEIEGSGTRLVDLPPGSCMYPTGYDGEHLFCGKPRRDPLTSYCEHHHTIAWVKNRKS